MANPGAPRLAARAVVIAAIVVGGLWWWTHQRPAPPATSTVVQPQLGSAAAPAPRPSAAPLAPARLTITVTDDKGPVAGAAVRLAPRDGEIIVVRTGRDGIAVADHLEPGSWSVSASAPDHVPTAHAQQLAAGADDRLALVLAAGGRALTGAVSDATGGPIAGARIDAARLDARTQPGDAVSTALTGPDGKYRLTVAEGALMVAATSADYAPQSRIVEVGRSGAIANFSLVPGGAIEGVVRDERTKQPIAGARVVARRDSPGRGRGPGMMLAETGSRRAIAGADGRFRLGGLRPGAWELAATSLGRHARAQTIIGLGVAEQVTDVEILIGAGPVIRGRVIDEAGAPAPETTVQAVTRGDSETTTADASGGFTIEGLRPAQYALIGSGGSGYLPNGTTGVALADKDVEGIVVTVRRGLSITGHVEPRQPCDVQVDLSGEAGRGGMILFPSASSGADGNFTIGPAPVGSVVLTARCASGDQGSAHVAISAGMPDTVVAVTPGASIAGRVLDGDGKPVAGIAVTASETSSGERTVITNGMVTSGMRAMTDPAGAYQITGLAAGSYRIGALDRGRPLRLRARLPQLELAAGEHKTGVDLAVDRSDGIIRGTVTGPDSNPLADAWVSAQQDIMATLAADLPSTAPGATVSRTMMVQTSDDGSGSGDAAIAPALTDAQGHYEIVGLPHAVYIVAAEAQRGQLRAHAAGVKPDATVDLRALGVTSLAGKVTGPSGPVAMFSVELDGPTASQRSFTDGSYSFARVDPGTYTVRVEASEGNGQGTVSVTPDQPATLDIALTANAVVIGKLVDPAGAPLAGQPVALAADHGDGRLMVSIEGAAPTSGPDGSFRLEHAAGRYAFMVMRPPSPFSKRGLVLEAGKTLDLGTITVAPPAPPPPAGSATP